LLNRLLGQKVAIATAKPQTTRHRILGVLTDKFCQIVFCDTPGVHRSDKLLNAAMVARAQAALADADVGLWVVDARRRGPEHQAALEMVLGRGVKPLAAVLNKCDLAVREELDALAVEIREAVAPQALLEISAKTGQGLVELKKVLAALLPEAPPPYPEDALTDQTLRDLAAEFVREAVFELTREEVPYSTAVTIDEFLEPDDPEASDALYRISATIHVEKETQKKVMIGRKGEMLKNVGRRARLSLEDLLEARVFLSLFVRTTKDWSKSRRDLSDFGYAD
jgi:GTP-binding protein Era